jgi:tRNA/rRNA methyltransferase/tRNA (cytidine32/uridine32-2'-O)-methyltransferase
VALLFGREDRGLPNEALDRAQVHVTIPTTGYASLNLAQAVMVALYELHVTAGDATRARKPPRKDAPPPEVVELERFHADAEAALRAIDFFKTRYPEHVLRAVRSLTARADPNARELSLLRAMAIEVVKNLERVRRGMAVQQEESRPSGDPRDHA